MGHEGHDHDHGHHDHGHHHHGAEVPHEHRSSAPVTVSTYLVTCSDTRDAKTDESGALMKTLVERAGHSVAGQTVIRDDAGAIRQELERAASLGARAVLISGGTGVSRRDVTVETVTALFEKHLDGFGELFRRLSFDDIGSAAMLTRAVAGTVKGSVVFAMPGSPRAVKLALERLILPELGHLVRELSR